jgi:hypothetical protein
VKVSSWIGQGFQVQTSLDLREWSAAFSLSNSTGSLQFAMLPSTNSVRFFRVRAQ